MSDESGTTTVIQANIADRGITERLVRLETKLDLALEKLGGVIGPDGPIRDHETRLRALEKRVWLAAGAAAAVGGTASTVAQMMGK